jgi:hypothetical protein
VIVNIVFLRIHYNYCYFYKKIKLLLVKLSVNM